MERPLPWLKRVFDMVDTDLLVDLDLSSLRRECSPAKYTACRSHQAKGDVTNLYKCLYCSRQKYSKSRGTDTRVRIRCECGGNHHDNKLRIHARWIPVDL